jgi:hypothetical protein
MVRAVEVWLKLGKKSASVVWTRRVLGDGQGLVTHALCMGEWKKKDRNKAIAFQAARLRLRLENVEAAWRETISVNFGCLQVPGDEG